MSKKPKKSRHRPYVQTVMKSDPISAEYQAEIDRSMADLAARYERMQKQLAKAEQKRARVEALQAAALAKAEAAEAIVENRRHEEALLSERIEAIRAASRQARIDAAENERQRRREDAGAARRRLQGERRAQQQAANREREHLARSRSQLELIDRDITEFRRELREIEQLMMPGNYAGSNHRGRASATHTHGGRR